MENHSSNTCKVLESRVDWLTCTCKPGYKASVLASSAERWTAQRVAEGFRLRDFRWSGYTGSSVDGITFGSREDGSILRLSGETTDAHVQSALVLADNVSRIDVQVTLLAESSAPNFAEQSHGQASQDPRVVSGMTRTSIIRSTPKGTTFYLGSRTSDRYFRVYDKTAESDGAYPPGTWRYEVEYKGDRAWMVSQRVRKPGNIAEAIRDIVESAFANYGISLPCLALQRSWRDAGIRSATNDEKRLAWLEKTIAPAISKLREGVPLETILIALGLFDSVDTMTGEINGTLFRQIRSVGLQLD